MNAQQTAKRKTKFSSLATTKKGTKGEAIVARWFEGKGYIPYKPERSNKPHVIDRVFIHKEALRVVFVDVKVAQERDCCADNGMDLSDYQTYLELSKQNEVWVVWLDTSRRSCYSIQINQHSAQFAKVEGEKIYFDLEVTKVLFTLTWSELDKL